jgi:RNA polymerase sigma factor (sigma-70 family)
LEAASVGEAEDLLSAIIQTQADPLIHRIVRAKLAPAEPADIEDVCSTAIVSLISTLDQMRESPSPETIANFEGFVAVIAYRACSDHVRRQFPQFHRLRNRVRYVLETDSQLALWQDSTGEWVCGLQGRNPAGGPAARDLVRREDECFHGLESIPRDQLGTLIREVFRLAGGPMRLDDVVRVAAQCWSISDAPEPVEISQLPLADSAPLSDANLERRQWLEGLWREILDLPPKQRAALLLNLRDESKSCATTVFVATGVAGLSQLAAALEMPVADFAELWRAMPLEDLQIAERLGITRQQVINLRKSAKERLARRLRPVVVIREGNLRHKGVKP